jgi:hypothetical protein
MRFSQDDQSILVGLAKVYETLAPIMQFYFYRREGKSHRCKMVKGHFLATPQEGTRIHEMLAPENLPRMAPAQWFLV